MNEPEQPDGAGGSRSREHPEVRFAPTLHQIDLSAATRELAGEPVRRGQRQKALYSYGRLTVALFSFEAGSGMGDHVAAGVVTIHVLGGRLRIKAQGAEHNLSAGTLLVLAPGVRHDVLAEEPSTMLLQVYLDEPPAAKV